MLILKTHTDEIIQLWDRDTSTLLGTITRLPPKDRFDEISFGFDFVSRINITRKKINVNGRDTHGRPQR